MTKEEIRALIQILQVTTETAFVPFSRSRNKEEKNLSLNYRVALQRNGKSVLVTDYSMGIGHIPGYDQRNRSVDYHNAIRNIVETGKSQILSKGQILMQGYSPIFPDIIDIWYCLISDADVLNYSSFDDWASCFGYDTDSRKAEKIYQECLKHALALKGALGYEAIEKLQEAFQDY